MGVMGLVSSWRPAVVRTLVVVAAATLAVGAWEVRADYLHAWSVWGHGGTTAGLSMWGLPMVWWGRIGKLLQFAAGLTVVLDLIGPQPLRAFGERANARWSRDRDYFRFVRIFRTWRLGRAILWSLFDSVDEYNHLGGVIRVSYLRDRPKELLWKPRALDAEALDRFQRELLVILHDSDGTPEEHWTVAHPVIFAFLYQQLPARQRISPEAMSRSARWNARLGSGLLMAFAVVWMAMLPGRYVIAQQWGRVAAVMVLLTAAAALAAAPYLPLALLSALLGPVAITARAIAWTMNRTEPGHQLRWTAFALFIAGFHFDLLSS